MTSIENLSNELFYEIFDYLDGCDIYQAFSNLNHRFQQLINCSFVLFKIKYDRLESGDVFMNNWKQIISYNRQQIFSVNLQMLSHINEVFSSSFLIDSSLNHLQSLVLCRLNTDIFMSILLKLAPLPRLLSLTIGIFNGSLDLTDTYRLIFNLPVLKYLKFSVYDEDLSVSLPLATNEQFSSIEHLVIGHYCTFNELSLITSYLPQLHHLKLTHDLNDDPNIRISSRNILSNLTSLSIHVYNLTFDRKIWYEYSSTELSKSTRLHIIHIPFANPYELISKYIKHILSITQIYYLEISQLQISIILLMKIINLLPEINSLKIHSLIYDEVRHLDGEELNSILAILITRKITRFYIERIIVIDEFFFLMMFLPYITDFKMNYLYNMNIESCLRDILIEINNKSNNHIRSLCFCVPTADDQMIKILQKMINNGKLLINYTIKRVVDQIYLQWK